METRAELLTNAFYEWEIRGRGWILYDIPVELEPPFHPYFGAYREKPYVDDGRRPGFFQSLKELFLPRKEDVSPEDEELYPLELFPFDDEGEDIYLLKLYIPKDHEITPLHSEQLLVVLAKSTYPISFEITGTKSDIRFQLALRACDAELVRRYVESFWPGVTTILEKEEKGDIIQDGKLFLAMDFGLAEEFMRPIQTLPGLKFDPYQSIISVLDSVNGGEQITIQILFKGAVNPWSGSIISSVLTSSGEPFFANAPEMVPCVKEKVESPLFGVTVRVICQSDTEEKTLRLLNRVAHCLEVATGSPVNRLMPLVHEGYTQDLRLSDIYLRESHRLGMLLNTSELATLIHIPENSTISSKLWKSARKTKELPPIATKKEFILGKNFHQGVTKPVTVSFEGRLRHTHIIGATGTGKSTFLASLIIQDINKGLGITLIDPHNDLVDTVLAHIPEERYKDVILLDPADTEYPIGINLLEAHDDLEKELLSTDIVASFRKLAISWGDQMTAVLSNALLAVLLHPDGGTLHDVRMFLLDSNFREKYIKAIPDPSVKFYWEREYPLLRTNSIGPILTRLDIFLRPRSIRNMVIQKRGINFDDILNSNKILLVKLSQGLIGVENSFLLGSLLLSKLHQAAFKRQGKDVRTPHFIYLDEFQSIITPSIKEMLSGVRKYMVGLVLSHQDMGQLKSTDSLLLGSVLGNTYTRIVFRVSELDGATLENGFTSFDRHDLQALSVGEAVIKIEQPAYDCSMDTELLPYVDEAKRGRIYESIRAYTRVTYATAKKEVEELIQSLYPTVEVVETKPPKTSVKYDVIQTEKENVIEKNQEELPLVATDQEKPTEQLRVHTYLQTLIKKMAESRGYKVTTEAPVSGGSVDMVIVKEETIYAIELSVTTDPEWEAHNIEKCIKAGYTYIISVSGDPRQLERIKEKCESSILNFESYKVSFLTPDKLFVLLDKNVGVTAQATETSMKGYRINVSYSDLSRDASTQKENAIKRSIYEALKKKR